LSRAQRRKLSTGGEGRRNERAEKVLQRVADRVNVNLRELSLDVAPFVRTMVVPNDLARFYAFYGFTPHHPPSFRFHRSSLAGSYFLGKCDVDHSIVYKSDVRGDELKTRGEVLKHRSLDIPLYEDEVIRIRDSFLVKTLVHSNSHDPENPEEFLIQNTVALHYANITGPPSRGASRTLRYRGSDHVHDCVIGSFAYVQKGELAHARIDPGRIWVQAGDSFEFVYQYPQDLLKSTHTWNPGGSPWVNSSISSRSARRITRTCSAWLPRSLWCPCRVEPM